MSACPTGRDFRPVLFDQHCCPYARPEVVSAGKEAVCPKCGGKRRDEQVTANTTQWVSCAVCAGSGRVMEGREVRYTGSKLEEFFGGFTPMHLVKHGKGASLYLGKALGQPADWNGFRRCWSGALPCWTIAATRGLTC